MGWVASAMSLPHNSKPFGADQSSEPRSSYVVVIVRAPAMSVEQLVNEDGERRPGVKEGGTGERGSVNIHTLLTLRH